MNKIRYAASAVLSFFLLLILTVTVYAISENRIITVDSNLIPYLNEFKDIYRVVCNKSFNGLIPVRGATIRMHKLPQSIIGLCEDREDAFRISFTPLYWDKYDDTDRRAVFFHEGLHCFFNEPHSEVKGSFMAPYYHRIEEKELRRQLVEYLNGHCDYVKE